MMLKPELCAFQPLHLEVITTEVSKSSPLVVTVGPQKVQVCLHPDAYDIRQTLIKGFSACGIH